MAYVYRGDKPGLGPSRRNQALKPCGTDTAYKRHLRNKEVPCSECVEAHRLYLRLKGPRPRQLQPCGTNAAYQRHRRNDEQPDADCLKARREYQANLRAQQKAANQ